MFGRLLKRLWPGRTLSPEDEMARQEARNLRADVESQRMGALSGPAIMTHGGKESTGHDRGDNL